MKTKKLFLFILILLIFTTASFAQESSASIDSDSDTQKQMTFNLSVFYPLSLNKNDDVATNINLSMFYGKVGSVSGVEMSGLVNYVKRDVVGLDFAGIANIVGNNMKGFQNAGIFNYVGGHASFFQAAGVVNYVEGGFSGFQTAGTANILKGELIGLQASPVNVAGNVTGVQMGVVNIGTKITGVQIGVINIADKIEGIPIGLINYSNKGNVHAVVWGSNIILTNVGVKFAVNDYFYSILSGGYNNNSKNVAKSLAFGYFMGLHFPIQDNFYLDADIGGYSVDNDKLFKAEEGIVNQNMLQVRLMAGFKFTKKVAVFAGIGENYTIDNNQKFKDGKGEIMFMAGFQLF